MNNYTWNGYCYEDVIAPLEASQQQDELTNEMLVARPTSLFNATNPKPSANANGQGYHLSMSYTDQSKW